MLPQLTYEEVNDYFNVLQAPTLTSDITDDVLSLPSPPPLHMSPTMLTEDDVISVSSDSRSTLSSEESESSEELTDQVLERVERIERLYNNMLPQLSYEEVRDYFNALLTEDDVIDISSDSSSTLKRPMRPPLIGNLKNTLTPKDPLRAID